MSAEEPAETSPHPGPKRRRAVAAVLGPVLLVVAAVLAVTLSGGGKPKAQAAPTPSPTPTPSPSAAPVLSTFSYLVLKVGDCVSEPGLSPALKRVAKDPCQDPHDEEVTGLVQLPGGLTTPLNLTQRARELCKPASDAVWHKQSAGLAPTLGTAIFTPDLPAYRAGNHTVTCLLQIAGGAAKLHAPLTH